MGSSKRGADTTRTLSDHTRTLYHRLHQALNLGTRYGTKWQCADIEIQRHVIRSIVAFLDSISKDSFHQPLIKDSIGDVVEALVWILECKNMAILSMTTNVTLKLVSILPYSVLQSYVLDLVSPLSSLLSYHQTDVATSCANALNHVLSNLSIKNEKAVWDVLKKRESVQHVICNIRSFSRGTLPFEKFQQMALLLSTILQRWPPSRFLVWSDANLMRTLLDILVKPDFCDKVEVLKLLSSIALCGSGALKLLENGETLLKMMVQCMNMSQPQSVRMEAFKLAQCLAINEQRFFKMMSLCCEPIIQAILSEMSKWSKKSGKVAVERISLVQEACLLALITRWGGKHHIYFWEHGIDKVLIGLLLENSHNKLHQSCLTMEEEISIAQEGLSSSYNLVLRNYIWNILGWLAIYCEEGFNPEINGNNLYIDVLITCSCLAFVDAIEKRHRLCQSVTADIVRSESATQAVLMMINSPCKYIAIKATFRLSEILRPNGKDILKHLLSTLEYVSSRNNFDRLQITIYLMALVCYIGLPESRQWVLEFSGMNILLGFTRWCLSKSIDLERVNFGPYLHNAFLEKACCYVSSEDWGGKDHIMLYSLWGLAELIKHSGYAVNNQEISCGSMKYSVTELLNNLHEVFIDTYSSGVRWFASYVLSSFGLYGFPNKLGKRIGKALGENYHADIKLVLASGECLSVHGVILAVRCPSLLPFQELHQRDKIANSSVPCPLGDDLKKEVRLSAHVDLQALLKLLDFVYLGYLETDEELLTKLKRISKGCKLQHLLQMLCRKIPRWGTPFPASNLSLGLGSLGHHFSDIILEAKSTELQSWSCDICPVSVPHMHVHKVILSTSCEYLRALFNSGMQESHSQTIKVPISWEALVKLVAWFYTDEIPNPPSGCIWENMSTKEKLYELEPYVELCWLAEFWFLEIAQEACSNVIVSRLDSSRELPIKIIQTAASLSLWKLAELAATCVAPFFRQLYDSGELDDLDEFLIDMIRSASVQYSQEGHIN
ncbi:BTB/POZ domain-containing protein At1g04390 isoform X1 [Cannabis sativa]|uniref:BTB/POZ domain-containing protein At1g04390 isoform X1 n=2 Tax=Cannabis sativa TaxID=3483 RepID=UPI0029CA9F18|nr:BTB/POZ domain-containing protein At1g04390 isoform X1 [Cannabis sativa]